MKVVKEVKELKRETEESQRERILFFVPLSQSQTLRKMKNRAFF